MPEPLKNAYSFDLIDQLAKEFKLHYSPFNKKKFTQSVLSDDWDNLELKQRMSRIVEVLGVCLPSDYPEAIDILIPVSKKFNGMIHMFFPEFVEQFGMEHFELSMNTLEQLTSGSTSEFAIRPFIIAQPKKAMKQMSLWSSSENEHVRRLASEGCRPRLPWAMALPEYKKDPAAVIEIIVKLIDDESLYVRRSVANNLNDISKDNPHLVIEIAEKYLGKSKEIDWVIKHACRGLLKKGDKKVMSIFGLAEAKHVDKVDQQVSKGEKLNFEFELFSKTKELGQLRLEFIIDFMKANGRTAGKIFKISEGDYSSNKRYVSKYFSFKQITTRKYYAGEHFISIVVNGDIVAKKAFQLI